MHQQKCMWIPEADNKLGSVVTKDGFSDWETMAVSLQICVYACSPQGDKLEVKMSELYYEKGFVDKEEAYT